MISLVQFPVETVREVASLLQNSNLSEVSLENTASGAKIGLKRVVYVAIAPPEISVEGVDAETPLEILETAAPNAINVESPAVGVFRVAKTPLQVGDEVEKRAVLGAVETLNIPTELRSPQKARVTEVRVADGQGVEWGQILLVLEPLETSS